MKPDLYTKAILTFIAVCLLVVVGQYFTTPAVAQNAPPVERVGSSGQGGLQIWRTKIDGKTFYIGTTSQGVVNLIPAK